MYPSEFSYHAPESLAEAVALLARHPEARILAGGHSLLPMMKLRIAQPEHLISLRRASGLEGIRCVDDTLVIGAMTVHRDVAFSGLARQTVPLVSDVAGVIADPQVRNRGTIGGSVAHADPAADYPAALLALDAAIVCFSADGERVVPATEFFVDMFTTALAESEIISEVRIRRSSPSWGSAYVKLRNPASRFAAAGAACVLGFSGDKPGMARVALTGITTHAVLCSEAQEALLEVSFDRHGEPMDAAKFDACCAMVCDGIELEPILNYTAEDRRQLATTAARRALRAAAQKARAAEQAL